MNPMVKALIRLVDDAPRYITEGDWSKLVEQMDKATLLYMKTDALYSFKYFTREDWLGREATDRLLSRINQRLDEFDQDSIVDMFWDLLT